MGNLSVRLIAPGVLILTLGSCVVMDLVAKKTISGPVTMLLFGICSINIS
jgi:hypothetical protein